MSQTPKDARTKTLECARCHKPVVKPYRFHRTPYHLECGILEAADAARQMRQKSGPYYDRWLNTAGPKGRPGGVPTPLDKALLKT